LEYLFIEKNHLYQTQQTAFGLRVCPQRFLIAKHPHRGIDSLEIGTSHVGIP
jgi:hypothetical protein